MSDEQTNELILRGEVAKFLHQITSGTMQSKEHLFQGPRGTGKTHGILQVIKYVAEQFPGVRILLARKYRDTLSEQVLPEWEAVLGAGHPSIGSVRRAGRSVPYNFPNGSTVALGGYDKAEKSKSSQWDWIYINEATELSEDDWIYAEATVRNYAMPLNGIIADCNPVEPSHWLNKRPEKPLLSADGEVVKDEQGFTVPLMKRHITTHKDNPRYFMDGVWTPVGADYMRSLENLTGVMRRRWLLGQWCSREGAVYGELWEPSVHIIEREELPHERIKGYFGCIDWGYRDPQCVMVWAYDEDKRMYCVAQYYRTQELPSYWKKVIRKLQGEYSVGKWVADPSRADYIAEYRKEGYKIRAAENSIENGIRAVEERLKIQEDDQPRLYFLRDCLREMDDKLLDSNLPTCAQEEFDVYEYPEDSRNGKRREAPIDCHNHAMDAMRYAVMYADKYLSAGKGSGFSVSSMVNL